MITISIVNVGHGDGIIIRFPNGKWGVVDCNVPSRKRGNPVLKFLSNKPNNETLSFICITHMDKDHFTGILDILTKYKNEMDYFLDCGEDYAVVAKVLKYTKDTQTDQRIRDEISQIYNIVKEKDDSKGLFHRIIDYDKPFPKISDDVEIKVLCPDEKDYKDMDETINKQREVKKKGEDVDLSFNEMSLGFYISYGATKILLGGDVANKTWDRIFRKPEIDIKPHFVKVSHHGSREGNPFILWKDIKKSSYGNSIYAAISSAGTNDHPDQWVLGMLSARTNIYCTNVSRHCKGPLSHSQTFLQRVVFEKSNTFLENATRIVAKKKKACYADEPLMAITFRANNEGKISLITPEVSCRYH